MILKEEDASPGFLCPDCAITISIPQCNACVHGNGYGKCKKLGDSPEEIRDGIRHDCEDSILDRSKWTYPEYAKMYPDVIQKAEAVGKIVGEPYKEDN